MPKTTNIQQTLWDLQKRFGDHAISTLGARGTSAAALPTGFPQLDAALGAGGIPDHGLTELVGVPTSGMTTLALRIVANAHAAGAPVVYLDGMGTFDPDYAARCGVDPDRLLLVQPEDAAQALLIGRDCARTNSVRLIVLDLVGLPMRGSKPLEHLREALVRARCAALLLHSEPVPAALNDLFQLQLRLAWAGWVTQGRDVTGYRVQVTIVKDKARAGERQIVLDLHPDRAVDGGAP